MLPMKMMLLTNREVLPTNFLVAKSIKTLLTKIPTTRMEVKVRMKDKDSKQYGGTNTG